MINPITTDKYDAVLFDLDGVLTQTEKIHSKCWKETFDSFLKLYTNQTESDFIPFVIERDYLKYVDGKPRNEAIKDFLNSRNIALPEGTPESPSTENSIHGLGNRKNELFNQKINTEKVKVYEGSVNLVNNLKNKGFNLGLVSSSKNCKKVLSVANLENLFECTIDGIEATKLGLKGKPAPDTYLEASKKINSTPDRTVVIEDAISGVQAGKNGGFGLVIGVARKNNKKELTENGADLVVEDLGELLI